MPKRCRDLREIPQSSGACRMGFVGIHLEPGALGGCRCWNWTTALKDRGHDVKHRPHAATQFEWTMSIIPSGR